MTTTLALFVALVVSGHDQGATVAGDVRTSTAETTAVEAIEQLLVRLGVEQSPEDYKVRSRASLALRDSYQKMIRGLIRLASSEQASPQYLAPHELSLRLLAEIASKDTVPTLIAHIEYRPPLNITNPLPPIGPYPCARALHQRVGPSCVPAIIEHLINTPEDQISDKAITLYAAVIEGCAETYYGVDPTGAFEEVVRDLQRRAAKVSPNVNIIRVLTEVQRLQAQYQASLKGGQK
jgi:hypothetical protein